MSDQEIVRAILSKDERITRMFFYHKCYPLFKSYFDNYYTDCESCTEFINEIYLYLMLPNADTQQSYLQGFTFRCSLTNWLKVVTQSYCYQLFRKKGDTIQENFDDTERFDTVSDSIDIESSVFDAADLQLVLQSMPNPRYRDLIRLRYIEELPNEEVAQRLEMSLDNFYNKHYFAKKQFLTALKKEGLI
jgi:RNA polymerase sigma factor (sigma-70 family)